MTLEARIPRVGKSRFSWLLGLSFASALVVCGCGGGGGGAAIPTPASYTVGGTVSGLNSGSQVVLLDNGGDSKTVTANGTFTFTTPLAGTTSYAVTVGTAPTGETCTVTNGSGTVGTANITNVAIACIPTYTVGGLVTGLASGSTKVVLLDSGGDALTVTANGTFSFTTSLTSGAVYAVTLATAPTGETCTVSNGSGTVASTDVTNVIVTCTAGVSGSKVLLELGHTQMINQIQMTGSRALSEDDSGHWVLWDVATDSMIANGESGCLSSSCKNLTFPLGSVALASQAVVIETTSALEICAASDGHVMATIPGAISWWKLASDGSYVATGSPTALRTWSPSGQLLYSLSGNYSMAVAYAAPSQIQVALGPAGANVIQTIALGSGSSSIGPQFLGQFNNWFVDGSRFQTLVGNTVYTYLNTSVQQDLTSLPSVQGLAGQGNWFWVPDSTGTINVYQVGSSAAPAATYASGVSTVSGTTLGILGTAQVTIVDLSGPTLTSSVHALPVSYGTAYAATSPTEWFIGSGFGVLFDGTSPTASPKYLAIGAAKSIAGGGGVAAIATASGKIFVINPQTSAVQTIDFFSNKVEMSTDGTVLAAITDTDLGSPPFSLQIYSLPSGTLSYTSGTSGPTYVVDYSLAGSGKLIAEVTAPNGQSENLQQVLSVSTGTVIWSSTTYLTPVVFSPDGSLFAVAIGNPQYSDPTGNIYQNGTLVGAVPGLPVGWIDNNRLLVDEYAGDPGCNCFRYTGTAIDSPSGTVLSSPVLPAFATIQTVTPNSVYSNEYNAVYSLTTSAPTWTGTPPSRWRANFVGAIAGAYAVVVSGSQVLAEPY